MAANTNDLPATAPSSSAKNPASGQDHPADHSLAEHLSAISITPAEISQEVGDLLRSDAARDCEARYTNGAFSCTFSYSLQVDGQNINQQDHELTVKVLTDLSDDAAGSCAFAQPKELVVTLPRGSALLGNVERLLQARRFAAGGAGTAGNDETELADQARDVAKTTRAGCISSLDGLMAEARYGTCLQEITTDERMTGGGSVRLATAVGIMAERSYAFLGALKSEFTTETVYAASLHPDQDGETLPLYCTLALQEVRSIQTDTGTCTAGGFGESSLEARLTGGRYGWPAEAAHQAVGVLAANGRVECTRDGRRLEGAPLALALSQGADLGDVRVRPTKAFHREQVQSLKQAFHKATGLDVDTDEGRSIASSFQSELKKRLSDARRAHDRVQRFPFAVSYEQALSELEDMATNSRDWFEERAPKEAGHIRDLLDRIRGMVNFATGREGEAFVDAHEFLTEQATNLAALPICKDGAIRLRDLITDPDCYQNPEAADEVRSLHEELQEHVEAGITAARAKAHLELYGFEQQFHEDDEYQAASEEARQKADALLKACADEIDASTQIPAIEAMVDELKEHEGARLYAFVAPGTCGADEAAPRTDGAAETGQGAAQDTVPQAPSSTVTYRSVARPEGWTRTLSDETDVDEFLVALRAQLISHVEAGERIIV